MVGPAVHGGLSGEEELPVDRDAVIDFSANLNPLGPPEEVLEAARRGVEEASGYPEPFQRGLRERYAGALGVSEEEVLFGCGSTELIFLVASLLRGGRVVVGRHEFGEYRRAVEVNGGSVVEAETGVVPGSGAYRDALERGVDGCFLCTPHNPSGVALEVEGVVEEFPDVLFVVDRAYAAFEPDGSGPGLRDFDNVVELHSLTKAFSVPGLRAGYCVSSSELIEEMMGFKQPWTVGWAAARAAEACLGQEVFLERSREFVEEERVFLRRELDGSFDVAPSAANFLLVEVGDASRVKRELLEQGLLVRDCSSFGLPRHIRVGLKGREENRHLVEALLDVAWE